MYLEMFVDILTIFIVLFLLRCIFDVISNIKVCQTCNEHNSIYVIKINLKKDSGDLPDYQNKIDNLKCQTKIDFVYDYLLEDSVCFSSRACEACHEIYKNNPVEMDID